MRPTEREPRNIRREVEEHFIGMRYPYDTRFGNSADTGLPHPAFDGPIKKRPPIQEL